MDYKKTIFQQLKLATSTLLLLSFSSGLLAGEKENRVINKAIQAYGGEKLIQLKAVKYTDNIQHFFKMQSGHSAQGPMTMHMNKKQLEVTLDLTNKHKTFKQTTTRLVGNHGHENLTTIHRTVFEGKSYVIDHALKQYQIAKSINYQNADFGFSQLLDPLIIKQLDKDRDNTRWIDIAIIQGKPHDVLIVNKDTETEYSLYLNQENGYLTRMVKKQGQQIRSYDFLNHKQVQGITWANELFVSTNEQAVYHTDSRVLSFDLVKGDDFSIPSGYELRKNLKAVDVSEFTIRELAKNVYFVGQGWGYSLFIDVGEYYISAGAWHYENNSDVWKKSLELLKKTTSIDKPVTQHIVTHHHTDHMSGLRDVVKQGVDLVIHPLNIKAVNEHLAQTLDNNRFVPIKESGFLADDKVMLFDVPTSHASHNLVIYLPEHKLLFTEDMFGSSYQTEFDSPNGWPNLDTYQRLSKLTDKINHLGLEVNQYVSSHHGRILNQAEIDQALMLNRPGKDELIKRLFSD